MMLFSRQNHLVKEVKKVRESPRVAKAVTMLESSQKGSSYKTSNRFAIIRINLEWLTTRIISSDFKEDVRWIDKIRTQYGNQKFKRYMDQ